MTRLHSVTCRGYLVPALGLALVASVSACHHAPATNPQNQQGSSSAQASQAHPTGPASPPVQATAATGTSVPSSAAADSASVTSAITADWNAFFSTATLSSERVKLLENGSQFASAVGSFASSPVAATVATKIDSVTLSSGSQASVVYDLTAQGAAVATGAKGTAVLQDGTWKVGDDVFCGLLAKAKGDGLPVTVPSACKSA